MAAAGMSRYQYLAADGGPHMLLPAEASATWTGVSQDYGRACTATAKAEMAAIQVGTTSALIFANPPMTAFGKSADGLVEVYYLKDWKDFNLDALITKATQSLNSGTMADTRTVLELSKPDAFLLYAGDTPRQTAYGVHRLTIPAGKYKVLVGTYSSNGQTVTIYRLKPVGK
jgi:hypothetical protein